MAASLLGFLLLGPLVDRAIERRSTPFERMLNKALPSTAGPSEWARAPVWARAVSTLLFILLAAGLAAITVGAALALDSPWLKGLVTYAFVGIFLGLGSVAKGRMGTRGPVATVFAYMIAWPFVLLLKAWGRL